MPVKALAALAGLVLLGATVLLSQDWFSNRTALISKDKKWALNALVRTAQWKEKSQEQALAKAIRSAEASAKATYPGHFHHPTNARVSRGRAEKVHKPLPKEVKAAEQQAAKLNSATKVLQTEEDNISKLRRIVAQKGKSIRSFTQRARHADRAVEEDKELAAMLREERAVQEKTYHEDLGALTKEARRAVQLERGGVSKLAVTKISGLKPLQILKEEDVELEKVPGDVREEDCMPPDVWLEDACRQSPRLDEPPLACGEKPDPEECSAWKAAWHNKMTVYKKALRENYPYRYSDQNRLHDDGWSMASENDRALPVRYPHKDLADLGDNYLSTAWSDREHGRRPRPFADDKIVPRDKALPTHSADGFLRTFLGKGEHTGPNLFAASMVTPDEKERLEDDKHNNLFFAHEQDRMGERSPTEPEVKRLLYGRSAAYMRNKFGYLADVYPSTRQMQRQEQPENVRERRRAYPDDQDGKSKTEADRYNDNGDEEFPARTNLASRFRRACDTCDWKPVMEPASEPCDGELCSDSKPQVHPASIRVCDPARGCVQHRDYVRADDSVEKQILEGQVNGRADPWGLSAEFGDDRMSPEQAVERKKYGH